MLQRLCLIPLREQDAAEIAVRERVVRAQLSAVRNAAEVIEAARLRERGAEIEVRRRRFRLQSRRDLEVAHRIADHPIPEIQQRHIVVQLGIVRRHLQHRLVADDVLGGHLGGSRAFSARDRIGGGEQLEPQVAHLVARALAPEHARGRQLGVARVRRGVVVGVFHRQPRALGQRDRRLVR